MLVNRWTAAIHDPPDHVIKILPVKDENSSAMTNELASTRINSNIILKPKRFVVQTLRKHNNLQNKMETLSYFVYG